jgi:hypothetical protein
MDTLKLATSPNATPQTDWTFQRALQNPGRGFNSHRRLQQQPRFEAGSRIRRPGRRESGLGGPRRHPPRRRDFNEWYELWVAVLALRRAVFDDLDRHITEDVSAGAA